MESIQWLQHFRLSASKDRFSLFVVIILVDVHLAALYGVTTKRLNDQVRRNRARFPEDFMFQLTAEEIASLRSQFATSNKGRGV
jgi:hypothetical protein